MQNENSSGININIGFLGVLGIVFIVLKLVGVIDWSWVWVLAPLWGGAAFVGVLLLILFGLVGLHELRDKWRIKKRLKDKIRNKEEKP